MSFYRHATTAAIAGLFAIGCSGESRPPEPTNPLNGLTAQEELFHRSEITRLSTEKAELHIRIDQALADRDTLLSNLSVACRNAVEIYRWGQEMEEIPADTAEAEIAHACPIEDHSVWQVRYRDAAILTPTINLYEVVQGIEAHLFVLGVTVESQGS